jgi:methyl coenzyme M reductase subunit D
LGLETEPTDVDDDVDKVIEDVEDAKELIDCAYLLADEVYPLEYYFKQMEEFNKSKFTMEDYSNNTTHLLDQIEE